jgi:hypothetical protein
MGGLLRTGAEWIVGGTEIPFKQTQPVGAADAIIDGAMESTGPLTSGGQWAKGTELQVSWTGQAVSQHLFSARWHNHRWRTRPANTGWNVSRTVRAATVANRIQYGKGLDIRSILPQNVSSRRPQTPSANGFHHASLEEFASQALKGPNWDFGRRAVCRRREDFADQGFFAIRVEIAGYAGISVLEPARGWG